MDQREKRGKLRYLKLQQKYQNTQKEYKQLLKKSTEQEREIKSLQSQLAKAKVVIAKKEMQNRRNVKRLVNIRSTLKNKTRYISKATTDHLKLVKEKLASEKLKGRELSADLHKMENEYCQLEEKYEEAQTQVHDFLEGAKRYMYVPNTMEGRKFTNEIRELYYHLLAENLPPGKIEKSIKVVLETFCPRIDTGLLKLPRRSLAREMRSSEMPTVAKAHEAVALSQMESCHVNSDGTTLNQKKIQGYLVGGVTIGVTNVTDGTALTAVEELDRLLHTIREVGQELGISQADKIGWSVPDVRPSINTEGIQCPCEGEEQHERNPDTTIPTDLGKEVLETFCGMHLGVNLRTVEVNAYAYIHVHIVQANLSF